MKTSKHHYMRWAWALMVVCLAPPGWAADETAIDLMHNRHRFHLYRTGLLIHAVGEGFHKYVGDHRSPWGGVGRRQGRRGRLLRRPTALLRFRHVSTGGASRLRLRIHGIRRQRLRVRLNGRALATVRLDGRWQALQLSLPPGRLREGENELLLGSSLGGGRAYLALHSLEFGPPGGEADTTWPAPLALSPRDSRPLIAGYRRLVVPLQVPAGATLLVGTFVKKISRVSIRVRSARGGGWRQLLATSQSAGSTLRRIDLGSVAQQLVLLELSGAGVAWSAPRIVVRHRALSPARHYRNAVIFVSDTLRSDRLRLYNAGSRVATPRLDAAFARGGIAFLHNQSISPSSPPSHATIQSGVLPRVHGIGGDDGKLRANTPLLSLLMRRAGVRAAYIGNNEFAMARFRRVGKWDSYRIPKSRDCSAMVKMMLAYARQQSSGNQRFLISSIAFEPHVPYRYHRGITDRFFAGPYDRRIGKKVYGSTLVKIVRGRIPMTSRRMAQLLALYDGEVAYQDSCVGSLLDGLRQMGQLQDTAIILTSDHGEGFGERGKYGHAFGLYGELLNVPLVVLAPGVTPAPRKVETVTSLLDLVPTVLDLMGLPVDRRLQGQSLIPFARRGQAAGPRVVVSEYGRSFALRARRWKYYVGYFGKEELFDLHRDPRELKNLSRSNAIALRYFRDLAGSHRVHRRRWKMARWGSLNNVSAAFLRDSHPNFGP